MFYIPTSSKIAHQIFEVSQLKKYFISPKIFCRIVFKSSIFMKVFQKRLFKSSNLQRWKKKGISAFNLHLYLWRSKSSSCLCGRLNLWRYIRRFTSESSTLRNFWAVKKNPNSLGPGFCFLFSPLSRIPRRTSWCFARYELWKWALFLLASWKSQTLESDL